MKKVALDLTKIFICLFSLLCARDLYVSKSALAQYETDDYLLFDRFNDSLEAPHTRPILCIIQLKMLLTWERTAQYWDPILHRKPGYTGLVNSPIQHGGL